MKHSKHYFIPVLLFLIVLSGCARESAPDPLEAARDKLTLANSIAFEAGMVWNNTFIGDTMVEPPRWGTYLRNDRESGYPFDFVFETEGYAVVYRNGELVDVDIEKKQLTTYTEEEAAEDLAYIGNYTTAMTPMAYVQDTGWVRAGKNGNIVIYEKTLFDKVEDEGEKLTVERLHIDSLQSLPVLHEQTYTLNGAPQQHLILTFSRFALNAHDSLFYLLPEGLTSIASADLEKHRNAKGLEPGDAFLPFDLVDTEGNTYSSETTSGKKRVFVFSFIGCGGCEYARKELANSGFEFSDEYVALYVNPTNSEEQIADYHADKPWPFKLCATDYAFSERYGVYTYPTFITVDEQGFVEEVVVGYEASFFTGKSK